MNAEIEFNCKKIIAIINNIKLAEKAAIIIEIDNVLLDFRNKINLNVLEVCNRCVELNIKLIFITDRYGTEKNIEYIKNILKENKITSHSIYFLKEGRTDIIKYKKNLLKSDLLLSYKVIACLCLTKNMNMYIETTNNIFNISKIDMLSVIYEEE